MSAGNFGMPGCSVRPTSTAPGRVVAEQSWAFVCVSVSTCRQSGIRGLTAVVWLRLFQHVPRTGLRAPTSSVRRCANLRVFHSKAMGRGRLVMTNCAAQPFTTVSQCRFSRISEMLTIHSKAADRCPTCRRALFPHHTQSKAVNARDKVNSTAFC